MIRGTITPLVKTKLEGNSMTEQHFAVSKRGVADKGKQLRRSGMLPANVVRPGMPSLSVMVSTREFEKLHKVVGDTSVVYLKVEGEVKEIPTLISEVQIDPTSSRLVHAVFRMVNLTVKVTAQIPVELTGEAKIDGATVVLVLNELEIEALPTNLPDKFTLDISGLTEVGQTLSTDDLQFDRSKVTLILDEDQAQATLVVVQELKEEVEEVAPVVEGEAATPTAEGAEPAATTEPATKAE